MEMYCDREKPRIRPAKSYPHGLIKHKSALYLTKGCPTSQTILDWYQKRYNITIQVLAKPAAGNGIQKTYTGLIHRIEFFNPSLFGLDEPDEDDVKKKDDEMFARFFPNHARKSADVKPQNKTEPKPIGPQVKRIILSDVQAMQGNISIDIKEIIAYEEQPSSRYQLLAPLIDGGPSLERIKECQLTGEVITLYYFGNNDGPINGMLTGTVKDIEVYQNSYGEMQEEYTLSIEGALSGKVENTQIKYHHILPTSYSHPTPMVGTPSPEMLDTWCKNNNLVTLITDESVYPNKGSLDSDSNGSGFYEDDQNPMFAFILNQRPF